MKSRLALAFSFLLVFHGVSALAAPDSADFLPGSSSLDAAMDADDASQMISIVDPGKPEVHLSATPEDLHRARVVAVVNKSEIGSTAQTVRVYVDGQLTYTFKTSTGREKHETTASGRRTFTTTPVGYFRPFQVERNHWSHAWHANMPYTVFFNGGIALHATTPHHYARLGHRDSGGCARLELKNAKIFYDLVRAAGIHEVNKIARNGKTVLDRDGNPVQIKAYDVLVIVENRI